MDVCVPGEVVRDGGVEVGELADSIEFIVVSMVMTGGASVSCPRTVVFFRLTVRSTSLQACEKQSIND